MASAPRADSASGIVSGSSESATISSSSSSSAVLTAKPVARSNADTCSCNAANSTVATSTPRSCYECINVALQSGEQCSVGPTGGCIASSDEADDEFYSSGDFTYCESADSVCTGCRGVWNQELISGMQANASLAVPAPRVCFGRNGCLCLAICEVAALRDSTIACATRESISTAAPRPATPAQTNANSSPQFGDYAWLFVFVGLFVLVSICSYQQTATDENVAVRATYRQRFRGRMKREAPKGPFLSLSGWLAYRERLIEAEREKISHGKAAVPRLDATFDAVRDLALTNAPPSRVLVQVGEGFRPMSPSHLSRQQYRAHAAIE